MHRSILLIFIVLSVTVDFSASRQEFKSSLSALDDGFCRALSFEGKMNELFSKYIALI